MGQRARFPAFARGSPCCYCLCPCQHFSTTFLEFSPPPNQRPCSLLLLQPMMLSWMRLKFLMATRFRMTQLDSRTPSPISQLQG